MWSQTQVLVLNTAVHSEIARTGTNSVAVGAFPVGLGLFVLVSANVIVLVSNKDGVKRICNEQDDKDISRSVFTI